MNEYSTRYSEAIDSCQTTEPDAWRSQKTTNRQGSGNVLDEEWPEGTNPLDLGDWSEITTLTAGQTPGGYLSQLEGVVHKVTRWVYEKRLELGVAREQARKDLTLSTYTEAYWKVDLHNLFHFLGLRLAGDAQSEIRQYANAIADMVKVWVPDAWSAFEDYRLNAMFFTAQEVQGLQAFMSACIDTVSENKLVEIPGTMNWIMESALEGSKLPLKTPSGKPTREANEFSAKLGKLMSIPKGKTIDEALADLQRRVDAR